MPLKLTFFGAAGGVTGSRHLLESDQARVLMDCGMFQGHRKESIERNKSLPFRPSELDAVMLSHAHIDHSGALPLLAKAGAEASIHCTPATQELCAVMIMDSARLQKNDAEFFNKIHRNSGQRIEPLYTEEDAEKVLANFKPHDYAAEFSPAKGVSARFLNAGHVLGSAMVQVDAQTSRGPRRILFSGDLGRRKSLLMHAPEPPAGVDALLIESTYGGRFHEDVSDAEGKLAAAIRRCAAEKGKILIPSFALERTQEIVFIIEKLRRENAVPKIPVYIDSPMAVNITEVFNRHLGGFCFDDEFKAYAAKEGDPFGFESLKYVRGSEESKKLNDMDGPMVIVSASGMCEGGRILHHLRNNIDKETTAILIVGYQAEGTLGRALADGVKTVKIFGLEHEVWARVETMHFFSSHADQGDILDFIGRLSPRPRSIFLVHGDGRERRALAEKLVSQGIGGVECPEFGQTFELEAP
ncbi:MAG: MBL fold metallo-hydrolase [Elusimicrobia bacterium]|nr:MBL fold metallo-hydrolase [Elusimicrobiota bacterium]